jgi:hypothetical protein
MPTVFLGSFPQSIGRPPKSPSEDGRCGYCDRSDAIVVKPISEPSPPTEHQLNKRGVNGLILIVGIGWAVWIVFRSKRKDFDADNDRDNKRGGY